MALGNGDLVQKSNPLRARLASYLALLLLALVSVNDGFAQIQIVNCNAPVQSRKRGIAVNSNMSAADFQALCARRIVVLRLGYKQLDRAVGCGDELHPGGLEQLFRLSKHH